MLTLEETRLRNVIYGLYCTCHPYRILYVGKTRTLMRSRLNAHRSHAEKNRHIPSAKWILKHGRENIEAVILEAADSSDQLDAMEMIWIEEFRQMGRRLLNVTAGGERTPGKNVTWGSKLDEEKVKLILRMRSEKVPVTEIAKTFSIAVVTVCRIWSGESWSWVEGPRSVKQHLTQVQVIDLERMLRVGYSNRDIAKHFNLAVGTVSQVRSGNLYPELSQGRPFPRDEFNGGVALRAKYRYGVATKLPEAATMLLLAGLGYSDGAISRAVGLNSGRVWANNALRGPGIRNLFDDLALPLLLRPSERVLDPVPEAVLESVKREAESFLSRRVRAEREEQENAEV